MGGADGVKQLLLDLRRIYVAIDGAASTIDEFEANDGFMGERTLHTYSDMYLRMETLYDLDPEQYSQLLVLYPKNDWGKVVDWKEARQSAAYDPDVGAVVLKDTLFPYLLVSSPALGGFGAYNCESTLRYLTHLRSAYANLKDTIMGQTPPELDLEAITIYPLYQNERVQNVVRALFAYLESIGNSFEEFETPANDIVRYFWEQVPDGTMFLNKDDIKDLKKKEFTNVWVIKPPDYKNIELFPKKTPEDAASLNRASQQRRIEEERNREIKLLFQNAHNNYVQQRTNSDPILVVSDRLAVLARNLVTIFKQKAISESKFTCPSFRDVIAKFQKDISEASHTSDDDRKKFFYIVKNFILRFQSQTLQKHNNCGIAFGSLKEYLEGIIQNSRIRRDVNLSRIGYAIYLTDKYIKVERASVGNLKDYFPGNFWFLWNKTNTNLVYLDDTTDNWETLKIALETFAKDKLIELQLG